MRINRVAKVSIAAALLLSAAWGLSACERQPPPQTSETRTVGEFQNIELHGGGELRIAVGSPASLQLSGSARTLADTDTRVSGDTLIIEVAKNHWNWMGNSGRFKASITVPELKSLRSEGAGDIRISGLNGGDHELHIAGAHDVKAEGKVDKLTIELDGAGSVDYRKVIATDARVTLNGAGSAEVQVTHLLQATVNGVGSIRYQGQPEKVESQIHGVGSISRR